MIAENKQLIEELTSGSVYDKIFFLGAGFSKGICSDYPLMKELSVKVKEEYEKEKGALAEHYKIIPDKLKDNIEELLSYLSGKLIWKDEITLALDKALYIDITEKVRECFAKISNDPDSSNLKTIAKEIYNKNWPVITLNYDLLMEYALCESNNKCQIASDQLYQIPILNKADRVKQITCPGIAIADQNRLYPHIIKLHGSINWLYQKNNEFGLIYYEDKVEEAETYMRGKWAYRKYHDDLVPFIIPPVLVKDSLFTHNILKILWIQAHKYLAYAKEIYIIGFSFPMTDLYVKFLFQSALKDNNDVKVFVVNKDTSIELKNRYKSTIEENKLNWKYCKEDEPITDFVNEKIKDEL